MNSDVIVRLAVSEDAPAVAELLLRARKAAVPTIPPLVHDDDEVRAWARDTLLPEHQVFVATAPGGGDLLAVMALGVAMVDQLYVDPDHTGQGIGTRLIEVAKRERPDRLELLTFQSNTGAQRFYERHGFTAIERTDGSGNEERSPDVHYAWQPEVVDQRRGDSRALAERTGAQLFDFEVAAIADLTPSMRRISLHAPELANFEYEPGQDVMLAVDDSGRRVLRRRYTIRAHDSTAATLSLDIVMHGDGPGARWAAAVTPGDRIEGIGPRGKVVLDPGSGWHVFAGDASFLAAATVMAEAVPPGEQAMSVIQIDAEDVGVLEPPANGSIEWVSTHDELLAAVGALEFPTEGTGHVYIGGESHAVIEIRDVFEGHGLSREQLSPKPYWRDGRSNQDHGEPERE